MRDLGTIEGRGQPAGSAPQETQRGGTRVNRRQLFRCGALTAAGLATLSGLEEVQTRRALAQTSGPDAGFRLLRDPVMECEPADPDRGLFVSHHAYEFRYQFDDFPDQLNP